MDEEPRPEVAKKSRRDHDGGKARARKGERAVNGLYNGAGSGPSEAILVFHRLDTVEGRRSLRGLILGWPGLALVSLDERHIIAVLRPGGAVLTGYGRYGS